jgi:hypothetical protein
MTSDFSWSVLIFATTGALTWAGAMLGVRLRRWRRLSEGERSDYTTVMASTLTLLGLVAGFAFSMATNRYEAAVEAEHREAAAIHLAARTASLLPDADVAAHVRALIARYAAERWREYTVGSGSSPGASGDLGKAVWSEVSAAAAKAPSPTMVVVLNAANGMLGAREATVAAFTDRMPLPAWALMVFLAVAANVILGYAAHRPDETLFVALPLSLAASFFLIAEMQSPGAGIITVEPRNLAAVAQALEAN